jgi:mannosyltransferase
MRSDTAPARYLAEAGSFASRHALALIVGAAAVLRFATLGTPAYWYDESLTVIRLDHGFRGMLEATAQGVTPPLYYILAWLWQHVFGSGELALRSLSALLGTATVPVVYAAARELASRRAALIAAALAATSPLLIWYSQELRTYPLLIFLAAVSFLFFAYALERPEIRWLWAWALASSLALTTHYFALALIVPEAVWLLFRARARRVDVLLAGAAVAVVGIGLLPLWAEQQGRPDWIGALLSRSGRLEAVPQQFVVGLSTPWRALPIVAGALLLAAVVIALIRSEGVTRRGVGVAGGVGLAGGLIVIVAALAGRDYILTKNLLELWVPLAIAVAAALGAQRLGPFGPALAVAICIGGVALSSWTAATPAAQRVDWRGVAEALGPAQGQRVIAAPGSLEGLPLSLYVDGGHLANGQRIVTSNLVLLWLRPVPDYRIGPCFWGADCGGIALGGAGPPFDAPPPFKLVGQGSTPRVTYRVYRANRPVRLPTVQGQNVIVQEPTG